MQHPFFTLLYLENSSLSSAVLLTYHLLDSGDWGIWLISRNFYEVSTMRSIVLGLEVTKAITADPQITLSCYKLDEML